jgi:hypothetical protein
MADKPLLEGMNTEVIVTRLPRTYTRAASSPFGFFNSSEREEVTLEYERLAVWASKGMDKLFKKIPGVMQAQADDTGFKIVICIDPRFDPEWVTAEVIAVAKTGKPPKPKKDESWDIPGAFLPLLSSFTFGADRGAEDDE